MKSRILKFLSSENKTSSQFAEEIGVQPSSVSHILSGRNNPSLDFVMKMLTRYPYISTHWLLFGKEPMYSQVVSPTLFDNIDSEKVPEASQETLSATFIEELEVGDTKSVSNRETTKTPSSIESAAAVERVVLFYSNGTFREYTPEGR